MQTFPLFFFKVSGAAWMVTCKKATKVLGMHQLTFMLSQILLPVQYDKPFEMCAISRPVSFLVPGYITWCSYIVTLSRRLFILRMFLTILIFILLHIRCLDLANCWYKILCADHGERLMFLLMSLPSGYLQPSSIVVFSVISVLSTNLTKNKKYIITMHAHTAISKKVVGRKAKSSSQDRKVMLVVSNLPFAGKQSLH